MIRPHYRKRPWFKFCRHDTWRLPYKNKSDCKTPERSIGLCFLQRKFDKTTSGWEIVDTIYCVCEDFCCFPELPRWAILCVEFFSDRNTPLSITICLCWYPGYFWCFKPEYIFLRWHIACSKKSCFFLKTERNFQRERFSRFCAKKRGGFWTWYFLSPLGPYSHSCASFGVQIEPKQREPEK